jgi:Protein of unknown function (DUF664)
VNAIERPLPPLNADERTTLESWLDFHRATLAIKCDGLGDEQAAAASVPPSGLTLTGLVQHLAEVERNWFRRVLAGRALDSTGRFSGQDVSLRWIYVHMIEEYARHNGHGDLVRERIDGATGVLHRLGDMRLPGTR